MPVLPRYRIGVITALAALTSMTMIAGPAARADQVDDRRAEAAALATRLAETARRIVALDAALRRSTDELESLQQSVTAAEEALAAATRRQAELRGRLVTQAQDAYVVGGSISVLRFLVQADGGDLIARRAYLRLVSGQDRLLIGQLRATREDLDGLRRRLDAARRRAKDQIDALAGDRGALDAAVRAQRANLQRVNGELATLVAAEQARRDAEAAQEAAARRSASPATAPPSTAAGQLLLQAPALSDTFACIRQLESGNNYAAPGGGAYQFLDSTWHSLGYLGTASDASPATQDEAAAKLQSQSGWSPWTTAPLCGRS